MLTTQRRNHQVQRREFSHTGRTALQMPNNSLSTKFPFGQALGEKCGNLLPLRPVATRHDRHNHAAALCPQTDPHADMVGPTRSAALPHQSVPQSGSDTPLSYQKSRDSSDRITSPRSGRCLAHRTRVAIHIARPKWTDRPLRRRTSGRRCESNPCC